ncbi:MAG TPA: DNA methyltransferase [Candidatus Absconditabacterales bacterium]|nr:DNA methyltransferase [Candidatus Absconditabacterales bacterium]
MINNKKILELIKKKGLDKFQDDILNELETATSEIIKNKLKEYSNKNRIVKNDNKKISFPAKEILNEVEIKKLPKWVREDIDNAMIIGESKNVIQISNGKKYHLKNSLNDLSGGEWTFFLNSVTNTRYTTNGDDSFAHHIRKIHPSPKPPQLMEEIIRFFTKENELVLDYFMGVGGTLLGASLSNRKAIGIDLEKKYIEAYKEACKYLNLKEQTTINGDSIEILKNPILLKNEIGDNKFSLILIDPPYGDMMARPKTGEAVKNGKDTSATPFTTLSNDLGNMSWDKFREIFKESIINSAKLLKNKGHIVVFIKDMQPKYNELNLLHADLIRDLSSIENISYLGTKIWADQGVNLYPYGYPYAYVSNQIHQYILIFKKVQTGLKIFGY